MREIQEGTATLSRIISDILYRRKSNNGTAQKNSTFFHWLGLFSPKQSRNFAKISFISYKNHYS